MTGTDATGTDANTQDPRPAVTTHPLLGVAGVLLGALIATCTGRLMNVDLADIRGALHLGVDEGSWINTTFNASPMFIRDFSGYWGACQVPDEYFWPAPLPTPGSSDFNMHSHHIQPALAQRVAPRRSWDCGFASKPIRWQSLTAFFSWLHAAWRASWWFPSCPKCQLSIGRSLLHQWRPNEKHTP
jgi:hypothetical protein